ncbi:SGNH/GDSL hydrolase family protein [Nocardioides sp.]|uniref:SGNH/GDSL hydrolase family protein n=1 Tax=Nocardioides sp. TaxID=35761 RepID=UPI002B269F46|nr:SGNH/GDSL hydrolase family protein [Nocardioides sp.]
MTWGRKVGALVVVAAAVAGCASEAAPTNDERPALRVLLAGDSITLGYHASDVASSYAALLLDDWGTRRAVEVTRAEEAGARGWRIARAVEALADPAWDVAVLEVGANDVGKTAVQEFADDYRDLVLAAERGEPELVVCLGPWNDGVRTPPYDLVVAQICDGDGRVHAPLSDLYDDAALHGPVGASTAFGPRDGFHPNDAGHAAIARRVAAAIVIE